jgi:hypothetical protein
MILNTILIIYLVTAINENLHVTATSARANQGTSAASQPIKYKDSTSTLPLNGKRIGSIYDADMRSFRPVSSHGREDVFTNEDTDNKSMFYQAKLVFRAIIHLINFSPAIFTCLIAAFSSAFRNYVWYDLIRFGLGRGGAVSSYFSCYGLTRSEYNMAI